MPSYVRWYRRHLALEVQYLYLLTVWNVQSVYILISQTFRRPEWDNEMIVSIVFVFLHTECEVAFEPYCFPSDWSSIEHPTAGSHITIVPVTSRKINPTITSYLTQQDLYTGCFTTCGHYCRRWFPRSLWPKNII